MLALIPLVVRLVGLACALSLVCAGPGAVGGIPPELFIFKNVVPIGDKGSPAGWKVAQVAISLVEITDAGPISVACPIEVGVPEISQEEGIVTDRMAQLAAAAASDEAAQVALSIPGLFSAERCDLFRKEMRRRLQQAISGAKVTNFQRTGLPRTTFP